MSEENCPFCNAEVKAEDMVKHVRSCPVERGAPYKEGECPSYVRQMIRKLLKSWETYETRH